MATISEDYVSFETAKLLKEKGFNECCYVKYKYVKEFDKYLQTTEYVDTDFKKYYYPCPTLQMAIKWLRKEHNLCIVPLPVVTDDDGEGGCLWKYTISMKLKVLFDSGNLYESPEIALDDAIKHCSENLI